MSSILNCGSAGVGFEPTTRFIHSKHMALAAGDAKRLARVRIHLRKPLRVERPLRMLEVIRADRLLLSERRRLTNSGSRGDISTIVHRHTKAVERENGQIVRRRAARGG